MLAGKADSLATVYPYAERQDVPASAEGSTGSAAGTHCGVLFSLGGVLHSIDQENSLCIHTGPGRCLGNSIYRNRLLRCASSELQCRSTADTETEASAAPNGAQPSLQRADSGREARQAVAAKISAARALARKLSEEQQAAVTAAKLAAEQAMDESEIDRYCIQAVICLPGVPHM